MSNKEIGLFNKFTVTRTDRKDRRRRKHYNCDYFVLDLTHDFLAIPALEAYANAARGGGYELLAKDLELKISEMRRRKDKAEGVMDNSEYMNVVKRTMLERPEIELSPEQISLVWNALALNGEAGEVAEVVKKGIFHEHGLDREKLIKEIGDCLWYIGAICRNLNISIGDAMQTNADKLAVRFPNGWNAEESKNRKDLREGE